MASRAIAISPPFSITMTFAPSCAAVVAATSPPLPAPTTTMSASSVSAMSVIGSGLSRHDADAPASVFPVEPVSPEALGAHPASAPVAARAPVAVSPARKLRRLMVFSPMISSQSNRWFYRVRRPSFLRALGSRRRLGWRMDGSHYRRRKRACHRAIAGIVGLETPEGTIPEKG